ncbi:MAG: hypothetical protein E7195_01395 [Peptococcaceae bacterium]|nr:hypothetical protein [Peptococcaceae bacterium]
MSLYHWGISRRTVSVLNMQNISCQWRSVSIEITCKSSQIIMHPAAKGARNRISLATHPRYQHG